MAGRRVSKISITPRLKPDISVSSGFTRSKPIKLSPSTTRSSQSSRSIVESPPPISRSKAISGLVAPSSRSRSKSIEISAPQSPSRFFSKKSIVGGSFQRASVEPISAGITRSKGINRLTEAPTIRSSIGGGSIKKSIYRPGSLRVSDL